MFLTDHALTERAWPEKRALSMGRRLILAYIFTNLYKVRLMSWPHPYNRAGALRGFCLGPRKQVIVLFHMYSST